MDLIGEETGRLTRAARWLDATRAELVGLAVLLTGALACTVLIWLGTVAEPSATSPPAGTDVGAPIEAVGPGAAVDGDGAWTGDAPAGPDAGPESGADDTSDTALVVHVSGAVDRPGLVEVPAGARVGDAVAAAGGVVADAAVDGINLARPLADGDHVHVPREGEVAPPHGASTDAGATGGADGGPVDLNRADAAALETLPGIGPSRAEAIIEHREAHGPFAVPGDLRAVPGIGEATFQRLADRVTTS